MHSFEILARINLEYTQKISEINRLEGAKSLLDELKEHIIPKGESDDYYSIKLKLENKEYKLSDVLDEPYGGAGFEVINNFNKNVEKLKKLIFECEEKMDNIDLIFNEFDDAIQKLPEGQKKENANDLQVQLHTYKYQYVTYFIFDSKSRDEFLENCSKAIGNARPLLSSDSSLGFFKWLANLFIKLVNLLLPEKNQVRLFKPNETDAEKIVKKFQGEMHLDEVVDKEKVLEDQTVKIN